MLTSLWGVSPCLSEPPVVGQPPSSAAADPRGCRHRGSARVDSIGREGLHVGSSDPSAIGHIHALWRQVGSSGGPTSTVEATICHRALLVPMLKIVHRRLSRCQQLQIPKVHKLLAMDVPLAKKKAPPAKSVQSDSSIDIVAHVITSAVHFES